MLNKDKKDKSHKGGFLVMFLNFSSGSYGFCLSVAIMLPKSINLVIK